MIQTKDLDQYLLKNIVGGFENDDPKVQVDGELDLELTVHDENVHEEVAVEPSYEYSDTNTYDSHIVGKMCDGLGFVHSSSPTPGVQIVMTSEIHEVQGNEHNSRDSGQSHMEVRDSLYGNDIELPDKGGK